MNTGRSCIYVDIDGTNEFVFTNDLLDYQFAQTCRRMQMAYDDIMAQLKMARMDYNKYDCFSKLILFKGGPRRESVPTYLTLVISIGYVANAVNGNYLFSLG